MLDENTTYVNIGSGFGALITIVCTAPVIPDENGHVKPGLDSLIETGFGLTHKVVNKQLRTATLERI